MSGQLFEPRDLDRVLVRIARGPLVALLKKNDGATEGLGQRLRSDEALRAVVSNVVDVGAQIGHLLKEREHAPLHAWLLRLGLRGDLHDVLVYLLRHAVEREKVGPQRDHAPGGAVPWARRTLWPRIGGAQAHDEVVWRTRVGRELHRLARVIDEWLAAAGGTATESSASGRGATISASGPTSSASSLVTHGDRGDMNLQGMVKV